MTSPTRYAPVMQMEETENGHFVSFDEYMKMKRERDAWKNEALNFHCTWMKCTYAESERIVQEYIDERLAEDVKLHHA